MSSATKHETMNDPLHVSVIMPVFNERYLVAEIVRRVLDLRHPSIRQLDLIIVDDGSTDGTRDVLRRLATEHPQRITYLEHEKNSGKGAAIRTGLARARGDVTVIQDADLEYNPADLPRLMVPFREFGADAVFGSRFMPSEYRRALSFRHTVANRILTLMSNIVSNLDLSDMETCYKAVRTQLLRSIPLRSNDFRIEPELTIKLAKRGALICEVPISYAGRSYAEGKKIGVLDALRAIGAILRHWAIDDLYEEDQYRSNLLLSLIGGPRVNQWIAETVRPFVGARVLELGAGIGNISRALIPRDRYTVADVNPNHLAYLRNFISGKPYMDVREIDPRSEADFAGLEETYDTVLCLNLIENIEDDSAALRRMRAALVPGGRLILLVPQDPRLHGTLDEALGHVRRYAVPALRELLEEADFEVERLFDFSRITTPSWWLQGRVLQRRSFSKVQLKVLNVLMWLVRRVDPILPWKGTSLIAIARRR